MIKYLKEYRFQITLFLFILVPILAIDTSTRAPRDYRFYDRWIISITAPVQSSLQWVLDRSVSVFQNYVYLWNTRKENLLLTETNRRLLSEIGQLREAKQENARLRVLMGFQEKMKLETIFARVIAKDVSTEFRAIRLNRGESAGIKKDMAVVTADGVVGRILRTTSHTADVVTIVDTLSAIDAIDERSRARGIVEGMSEDLCQLRFALRTDDIAPGDVLISSGLGGVFPKGVPVGTVSRVTRKPYGITQDIEVRPAVDFTKLEEVLVIVRQESQ
ncbi:MAG: rod shape-determining protein MreC [Bdellovibrionales bacterium]|nr:rod shape-determining protein MreC [Bdellovibrionales bacterium]